nr:hypothetical protein [Oceanococcus sp. HetDA_MAG_MS8]
MSRSKTAKDQFDDEPLDFEEASDDIAEHNAEADFSAKLVMSPSSSRARRNWRDVERAREEREMRRLLNPSDDWLSELEGLPEPDNPRS